MGALGVGPQVWVCPACPCLHQLRLLIKPQSALLLPAPVLASDHGPRRVHFRAIHSKLCSFGVNTQPRIPPPPCGEGSTSLQEPLLLGRGRHT